MPLCPSQPCRMCAACGLAAQLAQRGTTCYAASQRPAEDAVLVSLLTAHSALLSMLSMLCMSCCACRARQGEVGQGPLHRRHHLRQDRDLGPCPGRGSPLQGCSGGPAPSCWQGLSMRCAVRFARRSRSGIEQCAGCCIGVNRRAVGLSVGRGWGLCVAGGMRCDVVFG
jgi:hypothetical protein